MIEDNLLENLLWSSESVSLDFKQAQYLFNGASDEEKSELLKDILAFTNSWRLTDAYILIGVIEVKGGRSEPVGVTNHLISNTIQQFVNKKTNRPISFSLYQFSFESLKIDILQIPLQERPFYLRKDFGKLKQNIVYIRRGDSTDEANPDEIAIMKLRDQAGFYQSPEMNGTLDFGLNEKSAGLEYLRLQINIVIRNKDRSTPIENPIVTFYQGVAKVKINNLKTLLHYGEPLKEFYNVRFDKPNINNPILEEFRVTFGGKNSPLRESIYKLEITAHSELHFQGQAVSIGPTYQLKHETLFLNRLVEE